ncbi:MAG: 3-hydroxyacyl-CoA dehydrogenase family protein [Micropruina sp.]|uniref:3-hydroxyacyl-CoA dehydrogenase family protein n=1 Tax=Micropruina sp. TaxID=2737536 RepID=UPI0039E28A19
MPWDFSFADVKDRPVAVIGAGTLGRRIAMMFASRGGVARIHDRSAETLAAGIRYVEETLPGVVEKRGSGAVGTVEGCATLQEAVADAWLAIEAVPERLEIKIPLFGELDQLTHPDTVLATNSSSYPSRLMTERVRDKTRMCNMHFYMPPGANGMDLMSDGETDRGLLDSLLRTLPEYDIHPFEARRESVGFIFNRVWAAIKRESIAVVAEGVATPEDVDGLFKANWHLPRGPFAMMDGVGLDVVLDIEKHYQDVNPDLPHEVVELLEQYVSAGKLGVKTGEGWYDYGKSS